MIKSFNSSDKILSPLWKTEDAVMFYRSALEVFTEDMPMGLVMTNFGDGDTDYVTNGYWSTES